MEEQNPQTLKDLKKIRERYRTQAFAMMLEIAVIFGIPAALAYFFGKKFDADYDAGKKFTFAFLVFTFVFSWIIVVVRYRSISKKLRAADEAIRKEMEDK